MPRSGYGIQAEVSTSVLLVSPCMNAHLLLINPWIYDFAAFDYWLKPLGLLYLAAYLREAGYVAHLADCLDRFQPDLLEWQGRSTPHHRACGTGKFFRQKIAKPDALKHLPYHYCRYGVTEEIFLDMLRRVPRPAAVLVTSIMTYWYPGAARAIQLVRRIFPGAPVVLGGIYAMLCPDHAARVSGADYILQERDPNRITQFVNDLTGHQPDQPAPRPFPEHAPRPAYDLYGQLASVSLITSIGCPYHCTYCASNLLRPHFIQRPADAVCDEIEYYAVEKRVANIAFYDDALLVNAAAHIEPILERLIARRVPCAFHTPNGLHARYITDRLARLMFQAGFQTVRLGLETGDNAHQQRTGGKVSQEEFRQAVDALKRAGFRGRQIGAYLFAGLPGQGFAETEATIRFVNSLGVLANMSEYSPIPGTAAWDALEREGCVSRDDEPLLHNNTIFLYMKQRYAVEQIQALKDLARSLNAPIKAET